MEYLTKIVTQRRITSLNRLIFIKLTITNGKEGRPNWLMIHTRNTKIDYTWLATSLTIFNFWDFVSYAPVKLNPVGHPLDRPQDYNRSTSDHTGYSDNNSSYWHHSGITNGKNINGSGFWPQQLMTEFWPTNRFSIRIPWVSLGAHPGLALTCALMPTC